MVGNLYGVLFENGFFKVGMSGDVVSRVKSHIRASRSIGVSASVFFITEPVFAVEIAEKSLISYCNKNFKKVSDEYFEGVDFSTAKQAMTETKKLVLWGDEFESPMGSDGSVKIRVPFLIEAKSDRGEEKLTKDRIFALVAASGGGLTEGVLKNRNRTKKNKVAMVAREMAESGDLIASYKKHPINGCEVVTYFLPEQPTKNTA